jgi:hypothetical protein
MDEKYAAAIWGPHYWFFLHSIANVYPVHPNDTIKRKYYDLIVNFPVFIPNINMGDKFSQMLDEFPVTPYLKSRDSLLKWVYFLRNKYNSMLGKDSPVSFEKAQEEFLAQFDRNESSRVFATESFPVAWIRRHKNITIISLLLVVAFILFYASSPRT